MASYILAILVVGTPVLHLGLTKTYSSPCGAHWNLEIGDLRFIESPNFPKPYPGDVQCRWTVSTQRHSKILFYCMAVNTFRNQKGECTDMLYFSGHVKNGHYAPICDNSRGFKIIANSAEVYFGSNHTLHNNSQWMFPFGFDCAISIQEYSLCDDCGKKSMKNRIVGGEETGVHAWPWQVGVHWISGEELICGGSLISSEWVLTAAHCFDDADWDSILTWHSYLFVSLGDHEMDKEWETTHTVKRYISKIIMHSGYIITETIRINDIAVLKLSEPVEYSDVISPVCLPTIGQHNMFDGRWATATGWGKIHSNGSVSNELKQVLLPVITNAKCANITGFDIWDDQICTYLPGTSPCNGDSGGPLVVLDENKHYQQIGIVSGPGGRDKYCADEGNPTVYTRVTAYIEWIRYNTDAAYCSQG